MEVIVTISYYNVYILDDLPKNTTTLICQNLKLSYLPNLPPKLVKLYCSDNMLTMLPPLPKTLKIF